MSKTSSLVAATVIVVAGGSLPWQWMSSCGWLFSIRDRTYVITRLGRVEDVHCDGKWDVTGWSKGGLVADVVG